MGIIVRIGGRMTELPKKLLEVDTSKTNEKEDVIGVVESALFQQGYRIAELDQSRPWGGFIRLENDTANAFVEDFFPGLDPIDARLGDPEAALSPKILIVSPEQRLSWQYHDRRAERWAFINDGGYVRSSTDEQNEVTFAKAGDIVQFDTGERHRLVGALGHYTLVAEIWQHTDPTEPSNEDDIVRLEDDYKR